MDTRLVIDFGVIWDPVLIAFWAPKLAFSLFCRACFQVIFLSISESIFRRLGLHIQSFRKEIIAKVNGLRGRLVLVFACIAIVSCFLCFENKLKG